MGSILSSYFAALILGIPLGSWLADAFGWAMRSDAVFPTGALQFRLAVAEAFGLHAEVVPQAVERVAGLVGEGV